MGWGGVFEEFRMLLRLDENLLFLFYLAFLLLLLNISSDFQGRS